MAVYGPAESEDHVRVYDNVDDTLNNNAVRGRDTEVEEENRKVYDNTNRSSNTEGNPDTTETEEEADQNDEDNSITSIIVRMMGIQN